MRNLILTLTLFLYFLSSASAQEITIPKLPDFWETESYWEKYNLTSAITETIELLQTPEKWNHHTLRELDRRLEKESDYMSLHVSFFVLNKALALDKKDGPHKIDYDLWKTMEAELEELISELQKQLYIALEYTKYECSVPIPIYIFKKKDYRKLYNYCDVLFQKYSDKKCADYALTPNQWRDCLSKEEQEESALLLNKIDDTWARGEHYPVELLIRWTKGTSYQYIYEKCRFENVDKLEKKLDIDLVFIKNSLVGAGASVFGTRLPNSWNDKMMKNFELFDLLIGPGFGKVDIFNLMTGQAPKGLGYGFVIDSDPLTAATDKIEEELKVHPVFGDSK